MPYVTSVERIGYDRGIQQGIQERIQHEKNLISRLISKKFSSQPEKELSRINRLDADGLMELGELILDFESLKEVHEWIEERLMTKKS